MARKRKPANDAFYFSVEGETEKWYLEHLKKLINAELELQKASFRIAMVITVEQNPRKTPWRFISQGERIRVAHLCDYEAGENCLTRFQTVLDNMATAAKDNNLTYCLGYSNISFDLWMILHKQNCNGSRTNNDQYLSELNAAYSTAFSSMKSYKKEDDFKKLLQGITLSEVRKAIDRATVMQRDNENRYALRHYGGYAFYIDNPSLSIHERIQEIFAFCESKGVSV